MQRCSGLIYHLSSHKKEYLILSIIFILFLTGSVLTTVGDHENKRAMYEMGILLLMGNILVSMFLCAFYFMCPNYCCKGDEESANDSRF